MKADKAQPDADPRVYLAAERTMLAWISTSITLMGFGFVIARFGVFLRAFFLQGNGRAEASSGPSLLTGLALSGTGVLVCARSMVRHRAMVQAIDEVRFRGDYGLARGYAVVAVLLVVGVGDDGVAARAVAELASCRSSVTFRGFRYRALES